MNKPTDPTDLSLMKFGIGQPVSRNEDPVLVRGEGRYTDDVNIDGQLYAAFVRSPYAHARIRAIDTREAEALPGVVAVLTSKDLADVGPYIGRSKNKDQPIIAFERVIYAGQPVAAVAAADRATAEAAAAKIRVDYEELPAVIEIDEAIADGAPTRDLQKPMRFSKTPSNFR